MGRSQRAIQSRNQRKQKEFARQENAAKKKGKLREAEEKENEPNNRSKKTNDDAGSNDDIGADFWDVDVIPTTSKPTETDDEEEMLDLSSWNSVIEEKFKQSEENLGISTTHHCKTSHLKYLFLPQVRKLVQRSGPSLPCTSCSDDSGGTKVKPGKRVKKGGKKAPKVNKFSRSKGASDPDKMWICLTCANVGCSRVANGHALKHFESNPKHYLAVCLGTLQLWCYGCDDQVKLERLPAGPHFKTVKDCMLEIAKISPANIDIKGLMKAKGVTAKDEDDEDEVDDAEIDKDAVVVPKGQQSGTGLKGLKNLGNTCFYNSVMQNITHTALLREYFFGSGFSSLSVDSPNLGGEGRLTRALKNFLANMWYTGGTVFSPNVLFSTICGIAPRFRGYHQQDAHELFFTLIDGIKQEEVKRCREAEKDQTAIQKKAKDIHTFVDHVYGGRLVSVITCHTCKNVSSTYEPFFDLSLPIATSDDVSLALRTSLERSLSRPTSSSSTNTPSAGSEFVQLSKRQRKRLEQQEAQRRKEKEKETPQESVSESPTTIEPAQTTEVTAPETPNATESLPPVDTPQVGSDLPSTHENTEGNEDTSSVAPSSSSDQTPNTNAVSEPTPTRSDPLSTLSTPSTDIEPPPTKQSDVPVEAFFPDYRKSSLASDAVLGGKKSSKATVLSCLDCYTMPEILDEENRYGCEVCTRNKTGEVPSTLELDDEGGDKETEKRKLVKTLASKQLLLCQLPRVLVICLKRFKQTSRGGLSKNNEDVRFPAELDLSPYTFDGSQTPASQSQHQPSEQAKQSSRYRLNGIVEHSGGIHGGHYVAFIRSGKDWHFYSDSMGRKANEGEVLESEAYMLFYTQIPTRASPAASSSNPTPIYPTSPTTLVDTTPVTALESEVSPSETPSNSSSDSVELEPVAAIIEASTLQKTTKDDGGDIGLIYESSQLPPETDERITTSLEQDEERTSGETEVPEEPPLQPQQQEEGSPSHQVEDAEQQQPQPENPPSLQDCSITVN